MDNSQPSQSQSGGSSSHFKPRTVGFLVTGGKSRPDEPLSGLEFELSDPESEDMYRSIAGYCCPFDSADHSEGPYLFYSNTDFNPSKCEETVSRLPQTDHLQTMKWESSQYRPGTLGIMSQLENLMGRPSGLDSVYLAVPCYKIKRQDPTFKKELEGQLTIWRRFADPATGKITIHQRYMAVPVYIGPTSADDADAETAAETGDTTAGTGDTTAGTGDTAQTMSHGPEAGPSSDDHFSNEDDPFGLKDLERSLPVPSFYPVYGSGYSSGTGGNDLSAPPGLRSVLSQPKGELPKGSEIPRVPYSDETDEHTADSQYDVEESQGDTGGSGGVDDTEPTHLYGSNVVWSPDAGNLQPHGGLPSVRTSRIPPLGLGAGVKKLQRRLGMHPPGEVPR